VRECEWGEKKGSLYGSKGRRNPLEKGSRGFIAAGKNARAQEKSEYLRNKETISRLVLDTIGWRIQH